MPEVPTQKRLYGRLSSLAVVPAVAIALIVPVKAARVSCVINALETARSTGAPVVASIEACRGAHGESAGSAVGRKVG